MSLRVIVSFLLFFLAKNILAQDSLFAYLNEKNRTNTFAGLKAYYFWEEDNGKIKPESYKRVFKLNQAITINGNNEELNISDSLILNAVLTFSDDNTATFERSKFYQEVNGKAVKYHFPLVRSFTKTPESILFIKSEGKWKSQTLPNVLYFNVHADSSFHFSHANDSILFLSSSSTYKANGHYFIKRFWNSNGQLIDEQIFNFSGENVTKTLFEEFSVKPKHIIIFANGYRGRKKNKDITDNLVTHKDRYHYWLRLDKAFIRRIKPDDYFYIDGNHSIGTSNHRTMANFTLSYSRIKSIRKKEKHKDDYFLLNTTPNDSGFYQRKENGKLAGQAFLTSYCSTTFCGEVKDTLDLVCHSMGYSYTLGFIETVKDYVVLRNFYIIAPENARAGGMDWSLFQEVWQYGTHTEGENAEPIWEQDGIAPQVPVKGINEISNGGRVFFPKGTKHLNFVNSHMLNHYRWMFNDLKLGDKGFVKP
jgi:hypothetical protein